LYYQIVFRKMQSYNVALLLLVGIIGTFLGLSEAANQKCYVCDSKTNPIGCGQSVFSSIGVTQQSNCLCCTKSNKDSVITRACVANDAPMDCFPLIDRAVCLTDLCNSAPPTKVAFSLIGQAFLLVAALLAMFR